MTRNRIFSTKQTFFQLIMNEIEPSFPILQPFNKNWTPCFSRLTHDCVADVSVPDRFILSLTSLTSQQGGYKRVRFKCVLCNLLINPKLQNAPPPPHTSCALSHIDQAKTLKTFFLSHFLTTVNSLPLRTSILKDITLVFRWRDFTHPFPVHISYLSQAKFKFASPWARTTV